ncbi:MAG: polyphosphate:AMP phosphotransferase, partial [Myxococcales bacterium]|nr:polyphosphate:AMP phosphotransferase [Myxococcales bacterium]
LGLPSGEEAERPPMYAFWRVLPARGRIAAFMGSWYTNPILSRVYGETSDADLGAALARINAFERELVAGDVLVLKFWFHIAKKIQKKRLKQLAKDPELSWRVTERDWKHFELYDEFLPVAERAIRETSTGEAPWTIVEGTDRRYRELTVGRHILAAIAQRLEAEPAAAPAKEPPPRLERREDQPTILSLLDASKQIAPDAYAKKLRQLQGRLNRLSRDVARKGISGVFAFEGWDAAGKGGAIRRVTAALDARFYEVIPIAAPTDEELARPYMWRFWRQLPRAGQLTIFDRSWYGRVLVERVEGFASKEEWLRAYKEINQFESQLCEHGVALAKFWLHIDNDEQARRFAAREETSYKKYKITAEDYRNREKWDLYEDAVNEMVERTSTALTPWTLVEANDKRHARVKVLETCCAALENALERARKKRR